MTEPIFILLHSTGCRNEGLQVGKVSKVGHPAKCLPKPGEGSYLDSNKKKPTKSHSFSVHILFFLNGSKD